MQTQNTQVLFKSKTLRSNLDSKSAHYQDLFLRDPTKEEIDKKGAQRGTSSDFLDEISYKVDLEQIYQIKETCYYNDLMDYCPVLLEIVDGPLQKLYGSKKYILQVWTEGKKVFELLLNKQITFWSISYDFFIFRTAEGDEGHDHYQIVNLAKKNATLQIPAIFDESKFIPQYALYHQEAGVLFFADNEQILFKPIDFDVKPNSTETLEIGLDDFHTILPGLRIHGLLLNQNAFKDKYILVPLETSDDFQLDFNKLYIHEDNTYMFQQSREIVPRKSSIDPIKYTLHTYPKGINCTIVHRESGKVDLYYNQIRIDSPEDELVVDFTLSFDSLYFKMTNGEYRQLEHHNGGEFVFSQAEVVTTPDFDFSKVFYQKIKNIINIYTSYAFLKSYMLISHGPFVTCFDLVENELVKHQKFEHQVQQVFRKRQKNDDNAMDLGVILESGEIYTDMLEFMYDDSDFDLSKREKIDLKGKISQFSQDTGYYQWAYAIVKEGDSAKLFAMDNKDIFELDGVAGLNKYTNIIYIQQKSEQSFLLVQQGCTITIYEQTQSEEKDDDGKIISYGPPQLHKVDSYQYSPLLKKSKAGVETKLLIHSAVSNDIESFVFFADPFSFHMLNIKKKRFRQFKYQNCISMYLLDGNYIYTLSHSSPKAKIVSGLRLYDMKQIIETKTCQSYMLQRIQVGYSSYFDYSIQNNRLCYINSFDYINVVPALHRNAYPLMGLSKKYKIIETRILGNQFIALNNGNQLVSWNILSGKVLQKQKLIGTDYNEYRVFYDSNSKETDETVYKLGCYNKTLIIKNEAEEDYRDEDFYEAYQIQNSTQNQKTFLNTKEKKYHRFKLIEIMNTDQVLDHITFVFPYYTHKDCLQELYFSNDHQIMLERLADERVYLYQAEKLEGNEVKWRLHGKLNKFPDYLMKGSKYLSIMSPDLSRYLDVDKQVNRFKIVDTLTQKFVTYIPDDLMKLKKKSIPLHFANRFLFIDSNTFRIVNEEGFEKIVTFSNEIKDEALQQAEFKELEFNRIPLFNEEEARAAQLLVQPGQEDKGTDAVVKKEWEKRNYFTYRNQLKPRQTLERLIRKYQDYKSAYYLENKTTEAQIYPYMFTIDYQEYIKSGHFLVDLSFTYLHWSIMEQIEAGELKINSIDSATLELLLYNILPGGNTVLHRLCDKEDELKKIFLAAHPNDEDVTECKYHIPVLPNLRGKSPLHLCNENQDYKSMDTMLKYLSSYELDHHSRAINDLLPVFIEKSLPELPLYLDSRLVQTDQLRVIEKGSLNEDSLGIITSHIWFERKEFDNKLMAEKPIENRIKCDFMDIPNIYNFESQVSQEFFKALSETEDIDIFSRKSIRKVICYNFPPVKDFTIRRLFVPYCFFMLVFVTYLNAVYEHRHESNFIAINYIYQALLAVFAVYFLQNETKQLKDSGLEYLQSIWNYIDIIPPLFIFVIILFNILEDSYTIEVWLLRSIHAVATFLMWFKLLYFMRIFRKTSYLIRMIIIVIYDMRSFLLLLFITIVAFGDSLLSISLGNEVGDDQFVKDFPGAIFFTYRLILGDFDTTVFGPVANGLCLALFILCTVLNMIVMLNLLIAIISESFAAITANAENASYQEMASMISENAYLIPSAVTAEYNTKDKYLLVVTDLEQELAALKDPIIYKIQSLKKRLIQRFDKIDESLLERKAFEEQILKLLQQKQKQKSFEDERPKSRADQSF